LFPDGAKIAVVSGWDGGTNADLEMAAVLDIYGWKGTFFLSPECLGKDGCLSADQARSIRARGHEISSQGLLPVNPDTLTQEEWARQVAGSKQRLEQVLSAPVVSFAYPFPFDSERLWLAETVRAAGYSSARTTTPADILANRIEDWMRLPVTARALQDHMQLRERWDAIEDTGQGIFYLWGRPAEILDDTDLRADLECNLSWFCGRLDVWYCTQGELAEYLQNRAKG
jgi:peptidoglycan/xylan/chitin deacetylase (PgdA/CDA1 family)